MHTLRNVVALAHGRKNTFTKIILRAAGTEPQSAVRGARWSYRGPFSRRARALPAAKIKLIIASRDAWCKRTVKCLQRMGVSALHGICKPRTDHDTPDPNGWHIYGLESFKSYTLAKFS